MYREPATPSDAVELTQLAPKRWWHVREDDLAGFLGSRVLVDGGSYTSLDGTRRVRYVRGDADARYEVIDPAHGVTHQSLRAASRLPRPELASQAARAVWTAPVLGRPLRPVCFVGAFFRAESEPRMVRVLAYDDGVQVVRVAADGTEAGDTWHARADQALRQLERELGAHVGVLSAGDRVRPWRRVDPWGTTHRSRSTHTV